MMHKLLKFFLILIFVAVIISAVDTSISGEIRQTNTEQFSVIFTKFLLPFELLALLLTSAMIGAIIIAKKEVQK